ncbi:VOC family protein [Sphingobacterium multivorum]|uniref:VOC family protein n=1 Tax=Sphingobacterium multivorum TaxID=28454 RepID=UPI003DA66AF4
MENRFIQVAVVLLTLFSTSCNNSNNQTVKTKSKMDNLENTEKINVPKGSNVVNALIATEDTRKLIEFLEKVFGAKEDKNAFAVSESDGKVFNSSITIGESSIIIFDRKEGWKHTPSLLQVYVNDIDKKLETAVSLGATVTTKPTDFYGGKLARFIDPQGNLWWMFEIEEYNETDWEPSEESNNDENAVWSLDKDPNMAYIHNSLIQAMKNLNDFK